MGFPAGRLGTTDFLRATGLSKTEFFTKYRNDPQWIERFDIRWDPKSGRSRGKPGYQWGSFKVALNCAAFLFEA